MKVEVVKVLNTVMSTTLTPTDSRPRGKLFALLAIAFVAGLSTWVTVINGQPLFHPDTSAYLRGADYTVVHFFGDTFSTEWTQQRVLHLSATHNDLAAVTAPTPLNSPLEKSVLAGRSIYYGFVLYIGELASKLWFPAVLQGIIFAYLTYTVAVTCLGIGLVGFILIDLAILLITPAGLFISYLMPDVFAGYLIISGLALAIFWNALQVRDKVCLFAILAFSVLAHSSHLLLLGGLSALIFISNVYSGRRPRPIYNRILVLALVIGIAGETLFTLGTRLAIGAYPIRPPFLMARLIADGPGYQYLSKSCASTHYAVCKFMDRLPVSAPAFLWSMDPTTGVFSVADRATRRQLSSEQGKIALAILLAYPGQVVAHAISDSAKELVSVGLDNFLLNETQLSWAKAKLPLRYYNLLQAGPIQTSAIMWSTIRPIADVLYLCVYLLSLAGAMVVFTTGWLLPANDHNRYRMLVGLSVLTTMMNAAICGSLSEPLIRYQSRVAWVLPFLLLALTMKVITASKQSALPGIRLNAGTALGTDAP